MTLLLPDPCDRHCPDDFKKAASEILGEVRQPPRSDKELREAILWFIGAFASWEMGEHDTYQRVARNLVRAAHPHEPPLVVDPFAGGGSIPLEALRLGCEVFASDLNPVACLILKVMLQHIPRNGSSLAEELRLVGLEIRRQADQQLADLFPKDPDGATPLAYLWARTVKCEAPNCGAEIPVYNSPWLSKKGSSKARFFKETPDGRCQVLLITSKPLGGPIQFRITTGEGSETSKPGFVEMRGTKVEGQNANVLCPCCGVVLPGNKKNPRVPSQLAAQHGGADVVFDGQGRRLGGARLLAVVTLRPGERNRSYRLPTDQDYESVNKAQVLLAEMLDKWERGGRQGLCPVPDEPLPPVGTLGFRVQRYGISKWGDLFTARQKVTLHILVNLVRELNKDAVHPSVGDTLALALGKILRHCNVVSKWHRNSETVAGAFGMQTVPMSWDFPEMYPLVEYAGGLEDAINDVIEAVSTVADSVAGAGEVQLADAATHPLPNDSVAIWFTDPPYYDAVPYADLSDFFLVWLKRALPNQQLLRDPFDPRNPLSPKTRETIQDETKRDDGRSKDRAWFEDGIANAFAEGHRVLGDAGVGSVVFAHKTTEGWEALLSGMYRSGWTITGSWPIATERTARLRARESAALATSVHLICRPRPEGAPVGDWADVLRELPQRVGHWMQRLEREGIRGADLVFACIGPALEIFSRHSRVETADGREVPLGEYLEKVWEVVGRTALRQVLGTEDADARDGAVGAVEEDARLTALFLWTLETTKGDVATKVAASEGRGGAEAGDEYEAVSPPKAFTLPFDVVRRVAQPLGIDLPAWEKRIVETRKGVVRLLPVVQRAPLLFGKEAAAAEFISNAGDEKAQLNLLADLEGEQAPASQPGRKSKGTATGSATAGTSSQPKATTLDRVHAAMLLQKAGRTNELRHLLRAEKDRGPAFLRLANALSALYPRGSEEKRLVEAMLLAVPR